MDSDGKRRLVGEALYAEHGAWFNKLGFRMDAASNQVPDRAEFDRRARQSLDIGAQRCNERKAELLARHGCNAIRPFFVFAEAVWNSDLGMWLVLSMDLLPYAPWNTIYLPTDEPTARALDLPLHPGRCLDEVDSVIVAKLEPIRHSLVEDAHRVLASLNMDLVNEFQAVRESARASVVGYARTLTPVIVALLAERQRKSRLAAPLDGNSHARQGGM